MRVDTDWKDYSEEIIASLDYLQHVCEIIYKKR